MDTCTRFESFRALILAALGLTPLACGPGTGTTSDETGMQTGSTTTAGATTTVSAGTTTAAGSVGGTGTESPGSTGEAPTSTGASVGEDSTGPVQACGLECEDPVEIMQIGSDPPVPSGLVRCANGLIHRVEAALCVMPAIVGDCLEPLMGSECVADADCVEQPHGTCREAITCGFTAGICGCVYGCETDADCDPGSVCLCASEGVSARSRCVSAGCTTDADCGGNACAASTDPFNAPTVVDFACHTDADMCCSNADCEVGAECRFGTLAPDVWACDFGGDCGRPLVVDGRCETAAAVRRGDWRIALVGLTVPAAERAALAEHWSRMALAEHASVGSFARFILQLLAVGAPAELVAQAQRALADEVEHARVCFAVASAYAGAEVGPGPLPAACGALTADLDGVVRAVIAEACVGETLSALEVAEAAARADDPAVRGLLANIADDEARHAALGWSFVQWAVAGDAGLRARAAAWFAAAIAAAEARAGESPVDTALRRFGVVDPGLRTTLVQGGLAAVVRPCAAALLPAAA